MGEAAAAASPDLAAALAIADSAPGVREAASLLRARLAPLRVVVVDAMDMRHDTPAARGQRRQIFLAASDGHCWTVTTDASRIAGLIVTDLPPGAAPAAPA